MQPEQKLELEAIAKENGLPASGLCRMILTRFLNERKHD